MVKELDLGLKSAYDELFMDGKSREERKLPKIYNIPISEIDDFPDHPYQVRLDEDKQRNRDACTEKGKIGRNRYAFSVKRVGG